MPEGLVDARMMQRLAAQLRARDERERVARLGRVEAAIPPTEELIMSGPVPLEFTPTPSFGPSGENLDPRFGDSPEIGVSQANTMVSPMGGWGKERRLDDVRRGWASPASAESFYPAVEDAYQRSLEEQSIASAVRRQQEWLAARQQAMYYADPRRAAYRERQVLLEEPRAREAARQRRLEDTFGTAEDRARRIMELEASLRRE